jgi:HAE1 family hydrophobic/amphiphilic exporter-1
MYQQFALTIAISVLLSAFNALSLSPALSAMFLKPPKPARGPLGKFFGWFNRTFERSTNGYVTGCRLLVRRSILSILIIAGVAVGAGLFGGALPAGFLPEEDQGVFSINVQLPPGASLERTSAVLEKVEAILAKTAGVDSYNAIGGYGILTSSYQPNFGSFFVRLKPWEERQSKELHVRGVMATLQRELSRISEAVVFPFNIPTISGFGASSNSASRRNASWRRRANGQSLPISLLLLTRTILRSKSISTVKRHANSGYRSTKCFKQCLLFWLALM